MFRFFYGLHWSGGFGSDPGVLSLNFESEVSDCVAGYLIFLLHLIIKSLIFLSDGDGYSISPSEFDFPVEFCILFDF